MEKLHVASREAGAGPKQCLFLDFLILVYIQEVSMKD